MIMNIIHADRLAPAGFDHQGGTAFVRAKSRFVDDYGVGFTQMDDHTDRSGLRDGSRLRNSVNAAYMLKELAGPASMLRSLQEPPCRVG